ncbi:MAG: ABC transporter substrate-binding protein [Clostridia bacterium]|nr:ABC transporter substrate-binding protein [Clostridia bacterium]MBR0444901.1 ABC transporter substrate-binding protein [Clostridia bacterium]
MKKTLALILAVLFVLSLTGCKKKTAGSTGSGEFIYGLATEIDNFDPFVATTADAKSIYFNIYEGLTRVSPDGTFVPAVASEVTVSDDAKVYTFKLRDNVYFHNGNPVTMDDVLYSVQHAIDSALTGYGNIASYEATDSKTLVITLTNGSTDFIANASSAIVPKDSDNNGEHALAPVGTGPYAFSEYAVQDHVTLVKNDKYWGEPASLDKITIRFIASSSELLVNYQAGAINGFTANAGITEQVDKNASVINVGNSNAVQMLALNNSAAPFDNVKVRQAVSYAIDSDEIIDMVNYGYGVKIGSAMIPGLSAFFDDSLSSVYDVNLEKAKALLKEAGYPDGFSFTVKVPSVYQVHVDTAQVIVNQLAKVGITMKIQEVDWPTWLEKVYTNRDYEATIISVDGSIASPTAFLARYVSTAHNNFVNFNSADFDAVYAKAVAAVDQAERVQLFKEAQKVISDEAASVYIQDISNILVYTSAFTGFKDYPLYAVDFAAIARAAK